MQYVLLIYGEEGAWAALSDAEKARVSKEMGEFTRDLAQSGRLRGGNPLQPVATATTVRLRGGAHRRTPGPVADTREQLGGYLLIEAADLDEALAVVAAMPSVSPHTAIEVRPVLEVPS